MKEGGQEPRLERVEEWVADKWICEYKQFFQGFAQERKKYSNYRKESINRTQKWWFLLNMEVNISSLFKYVHYLNNDEKDATERN